MVSFSPKRGILGLLQLWLLVIGVYGATYKCSREEVPCGCGYWPVSTMERIIDGDDSVPYSWSMMVSIQLYGKMKHHCGGTILTDSHILTAASCFEDIDLNKPSNIGIKTGVYFFAEKNPIERMADAVFIHPKWQSETGALTNDIAIIHLKDPLNITLESYIARTCIPRRDASVDVTEQPRNGSELVTVGWGWTTYSEGFPSEIMQQVTIQTFHHDDPSCATSIYDPELQFCAGRQGNNTGQWFGPFCRTLNASLLCIFRSMYRYVTSIYVYLLHLLVRLFNMKVTSLPIVFS